MGQNQFIKSTVLRFDPSYSVPYNYFKYKLNKVFTLGSMLKFLAKVEMVV